MKTLLGLALMVCMQLCTTDKKTDTEIFEKRTSIVGKWQLVETCISPGAACILEKIKDGVIVEFKADGSYVVTNTKENNSSSWQCNGTYRLLEIQTLPAKNVVELSPGCNKALWNLYFNFNADNTLNLNPQCIEECRYTYKPI